MAYRKSFTKLLLLLTLTTIHQILGFTSLSNRLSLRSRPNCLWAVRSGKKSNKSKKKTSGSSGGFGGFGGGENSKSSKPMSTGSASLEGKVRTVSGFTGSGTKPLRTAANTFDKLRSDYGPECTNDVYCRSPLNNKELFWFVGKVATTPNTVATPEQAVISQKRLILEYAKHQLRPQNFGGKYSSSLELWLAPGDSEMDVVQNKVSLAKVTGSASSSLHEEFLVSMVGFNPEIYVGDEIQNGGLRVVRDEEGRPTKPEFEVNQSL